MPTRSKTRKPARRRTKANPARRPTTKPWMEMYIGGYVVPIYEIADPCADDGSPVHGFCQSDGDGVHRWWVVVDRDQSEELRWETVIHEVLHAISDMYHLDLSEKRVMMSALGLHQALAPYLARILRKPGRGAGCTKPGAGKSAPSPAAKAAKRRYRA